MESSWEATSTMTTAWRSSIFLSCQMSLVHIDTWSFGSFPTTATWSTRAFIASGCMAFFTASSLDLKYCSLVKWSQRFKRWWDMTIWKHGMPIILAKIWLQICTPLFEEIICQKTYTMSMIWHSVYHYVFGNTLLLCSSAPCNWHLIYWPPVSRHCLSSCGMTMLTILEESSLHHLIFSENQSCCFRQNRL